MYTNSSYRIYSADAELRNQETTQDRVQALFMEWLKNQYGHVVIEDNILVMPVKIIDRVGFAGTPVPRYGYLHFPKSKLTADQIALAERSRHCKSIGEVVGNIILTICDNFSMKRHIC